MVARLLHRMPPLAAVTVLFVGLTLPQALLGLPIAAAEVGPLPALGVLQKLPLSGRLAWGPQRVGENVMLATEKELLCLDAAGQEVWRMAWDHGPVIGQALPVDAHVWLSAADGLLCRVDAATGAVAATVEVGEPLAAGPVRDDQQLLVAGHSGVLFRVSLTSP